MSGENRTSGHPMGPDGLDLRPGGLDLGPDGLDLRPGGLDLGPDAAILDDQSACGRGERLALALARENINSLMEGSSRARVEVDVYELLKDSHYDTTDTMCQILPKGVVSVIGPASSPASGSTISHICGEKEANPSREDRPRGDPQAAVPPLRLRLLRLEELVHRFLISRETLSVRMLDEGLDPTPLLKEIRDDKRRSEDLHFLFHFRFHFRFHSTDAQELGMMSAFYKYILTTMLRPAARCPIEAGCSMPYRGRLLDAL
ncbi:Glutamate receptor ionotropic, kainate 5 [Liparis tanakae]|uniref:Glutamate receptor ionotropic, kainate 5 n=1 Tax=Liparis tanakae TaxID=230148 RepID=A0A4Z2HDP6_9TELE|nr:Glutamate receptor ionotropic, kainate 5 [Liparis tanakae]